MKTFDAETSSDAQLVTQYAEGRDQDAFAELVRRHARMVFNTVRRVLRNQEDAEEAFQAAFFALAKADKNIREPGAVAGWLHKAAFSCAVEIQRANARWNKKQKVRQRELESGSMNLSRRDDPSIGSQVEELEEVLDRELNELPEDLKTALVLCELEGLSQKQAGKQLGISPSTVNDRVAKGRRVLRGRLSRQGVTLAALAGVLSKTADSSATLSDHLIADTLAKAPLFAAGQSAMQLGVSNNVVMAANKSLTVLASVLLAVTKVKAVMILLTACAIIAIGGPLLQLVADNTKLRAAIGSVIATTVFVDDFADGDIDDGDPVSWIPAFNTGNLEVVDESLVLTGTRSAFATISNRGASGDFADISMRTQARLIEGQQIGIAVRWDERRDLSYACVVTTEQVVIGKGGTLEPFTRRPIEFDVTSQDIMMQLDVIGSRIKFWVWPADEGRPLQPTLEATDQSVQDGAIFLYVSSRASNGAVPPWEPVKGAFRFVHVATTPIHEVDKGKIK